MQLNALGQPKCDAVTVSLICTNFLAFVRFIQPITPMGIDELHTSWLTGSEWRMSK